MGRPEKVHSQGVAFGTQRSKFLLLLLLLLLLVLLNIFGGGVRQDTEHLMSAIQIWAGDPANRTHCVSL